MPFVKAQCENCQGVLDVDSSKKAAICPYCNTPYVVQDAINNYHTHIEHLHADVVNVNDDKSAKARMAAADAFIKLGKYQDALIAFREVSQLTPQDYRGWWGQIRALTCEFSVPLTKQSQLDEISALYKSMMVFIPDEDKSCIQEKYYSYYSEYQEQIDQARSSLQKQIAELERELLRLDKEYSDQNTPVCPEKTEWAQSYPGMFSAIITIGIIGYFVMSANLLLYLIVVFVITYFIHDFIICPRSHVRMEADLAAKRTLTQEYEEKRRSIGLRKTNLQHQLMNL